MKGFHPKATSAPPSGFLQKYLPLLLIVALAATVILPGLGKASLNDWDEAIYSQISKEIMSGGDWLTLHWGYQSWFEKPPLLMWGTAILYRFFGISEFSSRLISALAGIAVVGVVFLIADLLYDALVGIVASIVLLTGSEFVYRARFGTMDVLLALFIFLAIYGYLRLEKGNQGWWYLVAVSCALAVMTKGAAAVIAPAVVGFCMFVDGSIRSALRSRHFWQALALALLIAGPWHALMLVRHGREFLNTYLGRHVIARALMPIHTYYQGGRLFYVTVLEDEYFPWFFVVPFAVAVALRSVVRKQLPQVRIVLFTAALVFGLYTIVQTKFPWYIVPLYPALSILSAALIVQALRKTQSMAFSGLIVASFFSALLAPVKLVVLAAAGLLVCLLITRYSGKAELASRPAGFTLVLFLLASAIGKLPPVYQRGESPIARLGRMAAGATSADREPIVILDRPYGGTPGPSLLFYSNRPVEWARSREDLPQFINGSQSKRAIFAQNELQDLSRDYQIQVVAESGPLVYALMRPIALR